MSNSKKDMRDGLLSIFLNSCSLEMSNVLNMLELILI
jgi:hypothetical protein